MAKIRKYYYSFMYLALIGLPLLTRAQGMLEDEADQEMTNQTEAARNSAGFAETSDPGSGIAELVSLVLYAVFTLLGVIFVALIILAGFNWMTAQGEEDKVKTAKDTLKSAIIGLVIVMAAYSITYFVFASLDAATGSSGSVT